MALVKAENVSAQFNGFSRLPVLRQLGLMIGLSASVALGVAVVMWSQTPSYRTLYSSLSEKDAAQVLDALSKSGIVHKIDDSSGAILVDGDRVHDARLKLASQGLPKGTGVGYEVMEQEDGFGSSQFMETVRYQRAIEGELARTIMTLDNVQAARVHLAIPKQSVFVRERQEPSASVVVNLYPGRSLRDDQVQAIAYLVSSSVPNLRTGGVTIVDQRGHLLTARAGETDMAISARQLEYKDKLEGAYATRIEDILSPIVGAGGVKAQVNAEIDFTVTEQTQESFNPDAAAVRSEQTMEEVTEDAGGPSGVPGALTNSPPQDGAIGQADRQEQESDQNTASEELNRRRRTVRNYEVDKTISHTRLASGGVRRLSVAVLVDHRQTVNDAGEVVREPFAEEDLSRFTSLVRDAVGYNAQRGDSVNVISAAFSTPPEPEPLPDEPIWQQAWVAAAGKQFLAGVVVLLLAFGILRPVMRELATKGRQAPAAPMPMSQAAPQQMAEDQVSLGAQQVAGQLTGPSNYESNLNTARTMVAQDPRRVAQVVKNWVGTDA